MVKKTKCIPIPPKPPIGLMHRLLKLHSNAFGLVLLGGALQFAAIGTVLLLTVYPEYRSEHYKVLPIISIGVGWGVMVAGKVIGSYARMQLQRMQKAYITQLKIWCNRLENIEFDIVDKEECKKENKPRYLL